MSPQCCRPNFKIIGLLVLEKKIFKGFYHIWAWRPYWSCDLDNLYKLLFPLPRDAPCEVWLWMAKRFQRRRCLNIVNGRQWQRQRRRTPEHWYTISSPFEPDGSGELIKQTNTVITTTETQPSPVLAQIVNNTMPVNFILNLFQIMWFHESLPHVNITLTLSRLLVPLPDTLMN